jgi:predicted NBD/HSP70 family sugar kinase
MASKRDEHKRRIYDEIRSHPGISRNRISRICRIRPSTVSELVAQLLGDDLVTESHGESPHGQGRPEIALYPANSRFVVVGIHIVSKQLKAILMDTSETRLAEATLLLPDDLDNDTFVSNVVDVVRYLVEKRPPHAEAIGVTVIVPGLVRFDPRSWVLTTRFPNIRHVSIDRLERALEMRVVFRRALDADLQYLLLKNSVFREGGTLLFHWGYGIGAAYAYNGLIMESNKGSVLEIGHFRYNTDAIERCVCGLMGCLETEAALWALIPALETAVGPIPEDEDAFEVTRAVQRLAATPAFDQAVESVSRAVASLHAILNPNRFLFVGPFTESSEIVQRIRDRVLAMIIPSSADFVDIATVTVERGGETVAVSEALFRERLEGFLVDYGTPS